MRIEDTREDFPQLKPHETSTSSFAYLDSAATTLKPQVLLDRLLQFLSQEVSNIHRGAHTLSNLATTHYEESRRCVSQFLSASSEEEVIFTKGTTESINLVASLMGETLCAGDEVLITEMEHHSNILPWQRLCERKDLRLIVAPIEEDGSIELEKFRDLLGPRTRIAAFSYISNVLGMKNPVGEMIQLARENKTLTVLDAAQAVSCFKIDVQALNCDFLAFSAHKLFGPFGVGVLWGRLDLLKSFSPYQVGGGAISEVDFKGSQYLDSPHKFESGTPHISGVIGFKSSLDYFSKLDLELIRRHESSLVQRANEGLRDMGGVRFIGDPDQQVNLTSFVFEKIHSDDMGHLLNQQGIALRTGHLCAQPMMKKFGIPGVIRASFSIYNNDEDVTLFLESIRKAKELLS